MESGQKWDRNINSDLQFQVSKPLNITTTTKEVNQTFIITELFSQVPVVVQTNNVCGIESLELIRKHTSKSSNLI